MESLQFVFKTYQAPDVYLNHQEPKTDIIFRIFKFRVTVPLSVCDLSAQAWTK
jgi:hypothetical protein